MPFAKTKCLLILCFALLLGGCSGHTLAKREVVRAVFFGADQRVCLVLEGTDEPQEDKKSNYRIAMGEGATMSQALHDAEAGLAGQAYYGLMDVAVFPESVDHAQSQELGELLYDKAQPAPEASIFASAWDSDSAADLYDRLRAITTPHCGLERLFEQSDCCVIPLWQEKNYGCLLLQKDQAPLRVMQPEAARLVSVLSGQSSRMELTFADETARLTADARVEVVPQPDQTEVKLILRDARLSTLTDTISAQTAEQRLFAAWQQAFARYSNLETDPFRLDFWASCRFGPGAEARSPALTISFE